MIQGAHSVLAPASPQAAAIAHLAQFFFVLAAVIWLLVLGFLAYGLLRPRRLTEGEADARVTRSQLLAVSAAMGVSVVLLLGLGGLDYGTARRIEIGAGRDATDTLRVRLIGHQWWWEVQYEQATPPYRVTTANEIHMPVGRPVSLTLESRDVIHSFWPPNLMGKTDLIPGYTTRTVIQADTVGVFRAPCAEYCGVQHGKMALLIIAEPAESFAAWYANELHPAAPAAAAPANQGREVFMGSACPFCHMIRGTPSVGTVAPDLTHVAGRRTLAAGTIPNRRGELGAWIANPQAIKPGNQMPSNLVNGRDLNALLDYLATLR